MIKKQRQRVTLALAALAVGAMLPMAVASADDTGWVPDPTSLSVTDVTGFPPYSPEVLTGHESWSLFDFTTSHVLVPDQLSGVDTETIFGTFTNNDFSNGDFTIDFANFGGGWGNEWVAFANITGVSDLLITPFGDFPLFGTFFP